MSRQRAIYEYGGGRRKSRSVRDEGITQVPDAPETTPEPVPVTPLEAPLSECVPWVHLERDPPEYAACLDSFRQLGQITTAKDVWDALHDRLDKEDQEVGIVLLLDVGLKVRGAAEVSRGERDSTVIPIADILRLAILDGATAIVLIHNHPTGLSAPSDDDKTTTLALAAACEQVGLMLIDHVILGRSEFYSFADSGILKSEPVMPEEPGTPVVADSGARPFIMWVEDVIRESGKPYRPDYLMPDWRKRFRLWYDYGETVASAADMLRKWPWPSNAEPPTGPQLKALRARMERMLSNTEETPAR